MVYVGTCDDKIDPHGAWGKLTVPDHSVSEGSWYHGNLHGEGKIVREDGTVAEGSFYHGLQNGEGFVILPSGIIFTGDYVQGQLDRGSIKYPGTGNYIGDIEDIHPHGLGTMAYNDGTLEEGEWVFGSFTGFGKISKPDGRFSEGEFHDGLLNGEGVSHTQNERVEGQFKNGELIEGKITFVNGDIHEGKFIKNKMHGFGIITEAKNKIIIEAEFIHGEYANKAKAKVI
jgi:hypothetical protein